VGVSGVRLVLPGSLLGDVDEAVWPDLGEVLGYLGAFAGDYFYPVLYKELFIGGFDCFAMHVQEGGQLAAAGEGGAGLYDTVAYEPDQRVGDLLIYGGGGAPVYYYKGLEGQHAGKGKKFADYMVPPTR
jgi:hypothetical protein